MITNGSLETKGKVCHSIFYFIGECHGNSSLYEMPLVGSPKQA